MRCSEVPGIVATCALEESTEDARGELSPDNRERERKHPNERDALSPASRVPGCQDHAGTRNENEATRSEKVPGPPADFGSELHWR